MTALLQKDSKENLNNTGQLKYNLESKFLGKQINYILEMTMSKDIWIKNETELRAR